MPMFATQSLARCHTVLGKTKLGKRMNATQPLEVKEDAGVPGEETREQASRPRHEHAHSQTQHERTRVMN